MRQSGEFRPPKELVAIEMARVQGPGWVSLEPSGLTVHGRVVDAPERIPSRPLALAVAMSAVAGASAFGPPEIWMLGGGALALWLALRPAMKGATSFTMPWSEVTHVVQMPATPDTVCFVLEKPLGGPGAPEAFFFAPIDEDVPRFVSELRKVAPPSVAIDDESAHLPSPVADEDEDEDEDEDRYEG
jgi:hypothetical protein